MIDTLHMELVDYAVGKRTNLALQPSTIDLATGVPLWEVGLWVNDAGEMVSGAKGYRNTDTYNLTISPQHGAVRAFVHFSVPKVFHGGVNYYPVGCDGVRAVVERVERELAKDGVRTNLQKARLSRVDVFDNVVGDEPFPTYAPMFTLLSAKRQREKIEYAGGEGVTVTGYRWGNKQQVTVVYDKLEEMGKRKIDLAGYPKNTLRFEHRLLNGRKIQSSAGLVTVGDLWRGYDALRGTYRREMEYLFRHEPGEVTVLCLDSLRGELERWKETYGRQWRARFLKTYGLKHLLAFADVASIKRAFGDVQGNRMARRRVERELEGLHMSLAMAEREPVSMKALSTLYREIRGKLLRAA